MCQFNDQFNLLMSFHEEILAMLEEEEEEEEEDEQTESDEWIDMIDEQVFNFK